MAVRISVDIPEPLHAMLRVRAGQSGISVGAQIVRALEHTYSETSCGAYVTGPPVTGKGNLGRSFPVDENPHDVVFLT